MTEAEWLASDDPALLLDRARSNVWPGPVPASDRKLRLFAVAVSRRLGMHTNQRLSAVEAWADGGPVPEQDVFSYETRSAAVAAARVADDAYALSYTEGLSRGSVRMARAMKAALLRDIFGNPFRLPAKQSTHGVKHGSEVAVAATPSPGSSDSRGAVVPGHGVSGRLGTRELVTAWLTPTVVSLAHAAYDHRQDDGTLDPVTLLAVADALEEVGCDSVDLLQHLRGYQKCQICLAAGPHDETVCRCSPYLGGVCERGWVRDAGPHVRGCHVVDLLTGRE